MDERPDPLPRDAPASADAGGWIKFVAPIILGVLWLMAWEAWVRLGEIPDYKLPAPSAIAQTLHSEWPALADAWAVTLTTMLAALLLAVIVGVLLAVLFVTSRIVEFSLFPYAVMLQVTPLVAIAPFIVVWIGWERVWLTQLVCAWIVAFFPIVANTAMGLRSADRGLRDLFALYGATRWQRLRMLLAPSALPYFLAGLKVSANLALVGAVVAEFVIGTQVDNPGLASTIFESQLRSDTPTMFAALALVSLTGIMTFFATQLLSYLLLRRWHDSAVH
ncbi:MAG TPA: ABC transporter permease [Lacipirellula sp.]